VHGSKRAAQRVAAELTVVPPSRSAALTVADVLDAWLEMNIPTWAASTVRDQTSRVTLVKNDAIGRRAVGRLTVADSLEQSEAKRVQLQQAINAAMVRLAAANEACEPYDSIVEAAREAVTAAKETRRVALIRLSESGLLHRRARRADLAAADDRLGVAEQELADATEQGAPTNRKRSHAQRDLSAVRDGLSTHDMWDRSNYHPERLHEAETRLDALDTWKQWARGHPIDREQLADTVEALGHSPEAATDGTLALANAVRNWANQNKIELEPYRAKTIERPDLGIELGF
jgi:hypothetical protein